MRKTFLRSVSLFLCLMLLCGCSGPTIPPLPDPVSPSAAVPDSAPQSADAPEHTQTPSPEPAAEPTPEPTSEPAPETADAPLGDDWDFEIHFLDVGQADCMLVRCGEEAMLVDGGNVDDGSIVYRYLEQEGLEYLDYVVCTHAHEDHCGGLSAALNYAEAGIIYCPVTEYDTKAFSDVVRYAEAQGNFLTVPEPDTVFSLGAAEVTVLGPRFEYEDTNNTSIVLRIEYGETSFLLTGDAETLSENDILDAGCEVGSTVLKVGHHGSSTSTSYRWLNEVMPEYAVIQVGTDNSYGHPHDEVMSRLHDAGVTVYRTDTMGTVICYSNGETVTFTTESTALPETPEVQESVQAEGYIGNVNSKKFHLPSCSGLPAEENRIWFSDRSDAVEAGYSPCGSCNP